MISTFKRPFAKGVALCADWETNEKKGVQTKAGGQSSSGFRVILLAEKGSVFAGVTCVVLRYLSSFSTLLSASKCSLTFLPP